MEASEGYGPDGEVEMTGLPPVLDGPQLVSAAVASVDGESESDPAPQEEDFAVMPSPAVTKALVDIAIGLQDLSAKQDGLRELFEARIRSDEVQAKALERLHDQVVEYKTNFVRQEMQPLLRDLIYCYDFAADEAERAGRSESATSQETSRAFDHLRQMVADVLAKYDVEPYRSDGSDFDRREQQCVRTVPTIVEADEKKIAAVGAVGFRIADRIIRKEQVTVYKYTPASGALA